MAAMPRDYSPPRLPAFAGLIGVLLVLLAVAVPAVLGMPGLIPWAFGLLVALTLCKLIILHGNLLWLILAWFAVVAAFSEEFWRVPVPGFFAITADRIAIVLLMLLTLAMALVGRLQFKSTGFTGVVMLLMLAYFTISAAAHGFESSSDIASPHYRLLGGYWFPFFAYFILLQAIQRDNQLRKVLLFFFIFGLYLTFTGIMEAYRVRELIFPAYITDPDLGIHYGRSRGPFLVSAVMGLALVYIFFNNVLLARYLRGVARTVVLATLPFILVVIFFTATRSVWTSFLLGGVIWLLFSRARISRAGLICGVLAIAAVVAYGFRENIRSEDRHVGGWTDPEPIYARVGLAYSSMAMWADHPLFGVGFGRFRDEVGQYLNDPADKYQKFSAQTLEHNNFLGILATTGAVGAMLYVLLLLALLRESLILWKRLPPVSAGYWSRDFVVLYWVMYANFLIDGTFRETSIAPFANSLFFGLSGIMVAMNRLLAAEPLPRHLEPLPPLWNYERGPLVPAPRYNGSGRNGNGNGTPPSPPGGAPPPPPAAGPPPAPQNPALTIS